MTGLQTFRAALVPLALVGAAAVLLPDVAGAAAPRPVPSVTSVSASLGPTDGGTRVTVHGRNLGGLRSVYFGRSPGFRPRTVDPHTIVVDAPARAAGVVDVRVRTVAGTSARVPADRFTYLPQPQITSLSPAKGSTVGGTRVTIHGTDLAQLVSVRFGGVAGRAPHAVSSTQVQVTTPAHAAGTATVQVVTAGGISRAVAAGRFGYRSPSVPPVDGGAPSPVGDLTVTARSNTAATLRWTLPSDPIGSVVIRRADGAVAPATPTDGSASSVLGPKNTTWTDPSLVKDHAYSYSVFTASSTGDRYSAPSQIDNSLVFANPYDLAVVPGTSNGVCSTDPRLSGWVGRTDAITFATKLGVSDNGRPLHGGFTIYDGVPNTTTNNILVASVDSPPVPAGGGTAAVTIPVTDLRADGLQSGDTIDFTVAGLDDAENYYSFRSTCAFQFDPDPPTAPTISSSDFPADGSGLLSAGDQGQFTVGADDVAGPSGDSDVDHFVYSLTSRADVAAGRGPSVPAHYDLSAKDFQERFATIE